MQNALGYSCCLLYVGKCKDQYPLVSTIVDHSTLTWIANVSDIWNAKPSKIKV
jgi:hypothetical protein